jgi:carboxylesterase type B
LAEGAQASDDSPYGSPADPWAADLAFRCPATAQGGWHNAAHHPIYEYEFAHAIPGQEAQGAVHGSDLPYVFGYFPKWGNIAGQFADTMNASLVPLNRSRSRRSATQSLFPLAQQGERCHSSHEVQGE